MRVHAPKHLPDEPHQWANLHEWMIALNSRLRGFGAEYHRTPNAGQAFRKLNVSHKSSSSLANLCCLACFFPVRPGIADVGHDLSHLAIVPWCFQD
jgi:hypothetical protein